MSGFSFIPYDTKIDFISKRKITFSIVIISTLVMLLSLGFKGLNYGIDFKGGTLIEAEFDEKINITELREKLEGLNLGDISLQEFGTENKEISIRFENTQDDKISSSESKNNLETVKNILNKINNSKEVSYKKIENVGPKVGQEMVTNGLKAILLALIGILIYICVRFEWRFSICAIIALAHDCFLILGLYSITPLEFNETAITAILMTAGYSINDTIVVLDRIRENIKKYRDITLIEILNKSINETLSRTILTVFTIFLSVLALMLFGGSVIATFVLPIMITLIIGTLSSIFVAAPLLLFFDIKHGKALDEHEEMIKKSLETEGVFHINKDLKDN